jgi:hypothetical protein
MHRKSYPNPSSFGANDLSFAFPCMHTPTALTVPMKTVFAAFPSPPELGKHISSWRKAEKYLLNYIKSYKDVKAQTDVNTEQCQQFVICCIDKYNHKKEPSLKFHLIECAKPTDTGKMLNMFGYLLKGGESKSKYQIKQLFYCCFVDNLCESECLLEGKPPEASLKKTIVVILNPFGGKKKAPVIYEKWVLPLMHIAGYTVALHSKCLVVVKVIGQTLKSISKLLIEQDTQKTLPKRSTCRMSQLW